MVLPSKPRYIFAKKVWFFRSFINIFSIFAPRFVITLSSKSWVIGRGGTIREEDLIRALREGWIGGAGLDVVETEPLPADSPLWDMGNVILTSHYAGNTPHYTARALTLFLDNLRRYLSRRPLRNLVDMHRGY